MSSKGSGWTRRQFLTHVGHAGGAAAVYETMVALDMIATPEPWAGPPRLREGQGEGKSVLILGAGIGGLATAHTLSKYGYRCQVLEATSRAGGRNRSARRGDVIQENGHPDQECRFDEGLYLNLGPGRLPYHHRRILAACRELGVELEPYIMNTTGNLVHTQGRKQVYRRIANDTRGHVAELLAKAVNQGALDRELEYEEVDKESFLSLLQVFGPLGEGRGRRGGYDYTGSTRSGCEGTTPNVFAGCRKPAPLSLRDLLESSFWDDSFYDPVEFEWQPTLFQPVGGMDRIVDGFMRQVGHLVTFNAPVTDIRHTPDAVAVTYLDGAEEVTKVADYCVSNIPCPVLLPLIDGEDQGFSADFLEAVESARFSASCKVGWQANTRFWESDEYQIYGGISWTDDIIEQIWYPSNGYFGGKGTLTGAYIHDSPDRGAHATEFGKLPLRARLERAKRGAAQLQREFADDSIVPIDLGISIAWQNVPYQEGAWPGWDSVMNPEENKHYHRLLFPDRRFFVVGDQASHLPGWQEGAMMSSEHVIRLITEDPTLTDIPESCTAPDSIKVTRGHG